MNKIFVKNLSKNLCPRNLKSKILLDEKSEKLFLHTVQNIAYLLEQAIFGEVIYRHEKGVSRSPGLSRAGPPILKPTSYI